MSEYKKQQLFLENGSENRGIPLRPIEQLINFI